MKNKYPHLFIIALCLVLISAFVSGQFGFNDKKLNQLTSKNTTYIQYQNYNNNSEFYITRNLNTSYTNNRNEPLIIYGSILSIWGDHEPEDTSYVECRTSTFGSSNYILRDRTGTQLSFNLVANNLYAGQSFTFYCIIPPKESYILVPITDVATVSIETWNEVYL